MSKLRKNWAEWIVFAVGLALVVSVFAYLVYDGATMGTDPPSIEVRLGAPAARAHNFTVPVIVTNHGDETAEGVTVEVLMEGGSGQEPSRGELTVAFLPRRATREGFVTFQQDPRAARLTARVLGYEQP
ncbi:MAG TPA: hypothetical protein VEY11_06645 [Pyrinomonadaceae bacterium]|nr:hypothetical protein [Pyrinomonadaceae bacterium]